MSRMNTNTPNVITAANSITDSVACYWNTGTKRMEPFIGFGAGRKIYLSVPKCNLWVRPIMLSLGLARFNEVLTDLNHTTLHPVSWALLDKADKKIDHLSMMFYDLFDKEMTTGLETLVEALNLRYPLLPDVFEKMTSSEMSEMIKEVEKLSRGILAIPYNVRIENQTFDPEQPEIKQILDNYNPIRHRALVYLVWLLAE